MGLCIPKKKFKNAKKLDVKYLASFGKQLSIKYEEGDGESRSLSVLIRALSSQESRQGYSF